jgi:hypothetical protein
MVSTNTECRRCISWSLIDPGPKHNGWLGFDFVVKEASGQKSVEIIFARDCGFIAVEGGNDINDLWEQVLTGKVYWANSDERELTIRGVQNDNLFLLDFVANGESVCCTIKSTSLEIFIYSLGLEANRVRATGRIGYQ